MKRHASSFSLNLPSDLNINTQKFKQDHLLGFKSFKNIKKISNQNLESSKRKNKAKGSSFHNFKGKEKTKEKVLEKIDSKNKSSFRSQSQKTFEKEIDKSDLLKRYEEHLEKISETYKNNLDFLNLVEYIELQKQKIRKLELQLDKAKKNKPDNNEKVIHDLKKDNSILVEKLMDYKKLFDNRDWEFLLNKVEESNAVIKKLSKDKKHLSKELTQIKNSQIFEKLNSFMNDIFKIRNDVSSLLTAIDNFYHGKDFLFKSFLGIDMESFSHPTVQVSNDLAVIKRDLNKIFGIITDFHADRCAESVCKTQ